MAAIHKRRRHAEMNSQASTQGCNTLLLTYMGTATGARQIVRIDHALGVTAMCTIIIIILEHD